MLTITAQGARVESDRGEGAIDCMIRLTATSSFIAHGHFNDDVAGRQSGDAVVDGGVTT